MREAFLLLDDGRLSRPDSVMLVTPSLHFFPYVSFLATIPFQSYRWPARLAKVAGSAYTGKKRKLTLALIHNLLP